MTVAVAPRKKTGFRPRYPGELPTLGWEVLDFGHDVLRSPADELAPFRYTDEQAQHVLRMYSLDANGRRLYRRVHEEQAKGWGKSPFAAAIALTEFAGPVCFDGWDSEGRPVGVPWGSGGRPPPWVQVAAVSEDQTANTYNALYGLLTADGGAPARAMNIDEGRTRLYRKDLPAAFLERVTASAGSREGQPVSFAVLDEPQLWTEANQGVRLARTILRNVAKTNGWGLFTGNAPVLGVGSVAEVFRDTAPGALHLANRPTGAPDPDWSLVQMAEALQEVYRDAWWIDLPRILEEIQDPAQPWRDSLRFFFNLPDVGGADEPWISARPWEECAGTTPLDPALPVFASVRMAHDHRCAAIAWAQRQDERVILRARVFESDGIVDGGQLEEHLMGLSREYRALVVADMAGRRKVVRPGPSIDYHGGFFERSAQLLRTRGLVMVDVPNSPERLAPAAETLLELVLQGKLEHDGDPDLARHVANVAATPSARGWTIQSNANVRVEAAIASMHAAHRALLAPVATPKAAVFRSF